MTAVLYLARNGEDAGEERFAFLPDRSRDANERRLGAYIQRHGWVDASDPADRDPFDYFRADVTYVATIAYLEN